MRAPPRTTQPRLTVYAAWAALIGGLALGCSEPTVPPTPPSVLLITIDTLRADHLGTYGYPRATSPEIDALAAQSVVFERAIAASASTVPSHASMMTGRYPREHSVGYSNGATRLVGGVTLAEALRSAGYQTAAFVSNQVLRKSVGLDRGFDLYDADLTQSETNRGFVERVADATTSKALQWLAGAARDRPIFLWVHYQDPHGPYDPPLDHSRPFERTPAPDEPALPIVGHEGLNGIPAYQRIAGLDRLSQYRDRYAGEIHYADAATGRLVRAIDAARPEMIIALTSDHGEAFGEHDRYLVHFWTSTPENAHVPFLLRAPGLAPERRRELVSHVDLLPTLLELAQLRPHFEVSGEALGPRLRAAEPLPERTVYCDVGRELSAYSKHRFLRVDRALGAWDLEPEGSGTDWLPPDAGATYRWDKDGSWERTTESTPLPAAVRDYTSRAEALFELQLDVDERAQLRALGYAEP